jgi:hypothetical protein
MRIVPFSPAALDRRHLVNRRSAGRQEPCLFFQINALGVPLSCSCNAGRLSRSAEDDEIARQA